MPLAPSPIADGVRLHHSHGGHKSTRNAVCMPASYAQSDSQSGKSTEAGGCKLQIIEGAPWGGVGAEATQGDLRQKRRAALLPPGRTTYLCTHRKQP